MARFEVDYHGQVPGMEHREWHIGCREVTRPGWIWRVYANDEVVASGSVTGASKRKRGKAIRLARRIANTYTYSEDNINTKDARAMRARIEALEKEVLS